MLYLYSRLVVVVQFPVDVLTMYCGHFQVPDASVKVAPVSRRCCYNGSIDSESGVIVRCPSNPQSSKMKIERGDARSYELHWQQIHKSLYTFIKENVFGILRQDDYQRPPLSSVLESAFAFSPIN